MKAFTFILILFPFFSFSQSTDELLQGKLNEENVTSGMITSYNDILPDEVLRLMTNPVDLNSNDISPLINAQLISETDANKILSHRKTFGNILSIEELQVAGIRKETILLIKPYVFVTTGNMVIEKKKSDIFFRLS